MTFCGNRNGRHGRWLGLAGLAAGWWFGAAAELPPPPALQLVLTNGSQRIELPPYPSVEAYQVQSTTDLSAGFADNLTGRLTGYTWTDSASGARGFYRLKVTPLDPQALLAVIVLNRLAYGPTPDELERVLTGPNPLGAEAYLEEQLAPERIAEDLDAPVPALDWQFVSVSGIGSSSLLYLYLGSPGEVYMDDLTLVRGSVAGSGVNLIRNGDFETALTGPWTVSTNHQGTELSSTVKHGGNLSLHLVATSGGTTQASAVWQTITPAVTVGQTYTLSYWYLPSTNGTTLSARLSQSGDYAKGIDTTHSLVPNQYQPGSIYGKLTGVTASLDELRAWYALHAVRSKRQLFEVLTQFFDNHFTTQYGKSREFIDGYLTNQTTVSRLAANFEFRELTKWRQVLLDPKGTFYDLLKVSVESPAMIVYLDTVTSSGGNANENFSRELVELFTLGVDNGYDQTDIEQMSRAWTGWRADKLPLGQENNPFATRVANREGDPGYWTLQFRTDKHDTGAKTIFKSKTVDARFGPRYAGRSYQLSLPARTGAAGMQDGYDLIRHLADLPYTQEYLSVKLCRLFVHENFHHGIDDYSDPTNLTPEGQLILECMNAWDIPAADGRKGNLRQVLRAIFNSALFRTHAAAQQKVKTPLEFVIGTIRALRAAKPGGGFTADTDGYDVLTTLRRLNFKLFDRAEPDGWPEFGRDWVSTATLVERMRYAQNFLIAPRDPLKALDFGSTGDDNVSDPVALLKLKLPAAQWRNPAAVVDYFLQILFPGEGRANLALDRTGAIAFLNANDTGTPNSSPLANLDAASTSYDGRVRGLVALLLGWPRFQEQ